MKKMLLMAMAAVAMVGCSQNEEIENVAQKAEINFQTAVSSTTRADITNLAALQTSGFTVYAYNTENALMANVTDAAKMIDFINGKKATFSSGWSIADGPYHWPLFNNIQFFAYGNPGTATMAYNVPETTNVYPSLTYTVADVDSQTDLVVAKALNANQKANSAGVSLAFTHALSQINFTVKSADDYTYKVKSIGISGVSNSGTYQFSSGEWINPSGSATYEKAFELADEVVATTEGAVINTAWMLMPQAMPTADGKASLKIVYDIYVGTEKLIDKTVNIDLKETSDWGIGKKIRYTLSLSYTGAEIKLIVPEVGAWNTTDDTNVEK